MTLPPVSIAPPGWYRTGYGDVRWWDGYAWTEPVPSGSDTSDSSDSNDHGWAVLAHLGIFLFGIVVPALIRYAKPQPSAFAVIGAVRAGQDRPWRYPITIRWVRDDDRD